MYCAEREDMARTLLLHTIMWKLLRQLRGKIMVGITKTFFPKEGTAVAKKWIAKI